jgi:hypothetical protein
MKKLLSDTYRQSRGDWSRFLSLSCVSCCNFLFYYQKDGPGPLKRSYVDRINGKNLLLTQKGYVFCPHCKVCLGFEEPYSKEHNRPAIRWAVEAIEYKIVSAHQVD